MLCVFIWEIKFCYPFFEEKLRKNDFFWKKVLKNFAGLKIYYTFALEIKTVRIAQLVRASDCGSEGRGFESLFSPNKKSLIRRLFLFNDVLKFMSLVWAFLMVAKFALHGKYLANNCIRCIYYKILVSFRIYFNLIFYICNVEVDFKYLTLKLLWKVVQSVINLILMMLNFVRFVGLRLI